MAWTLLAEDYSRALPGTVRLTATGDPDTEVAIYRTSGNRDPQLIRNMTGAVTSPSGLYRVLDAEAPFGPVTYRLTAADDPTNILAVSNTITVPAPADGRALIRSILSPYGEWAAVTIVDELDLNYRTSSTVFDVVNSTDAVVISDVRRDRSGTLVFLAEGIDETDFLLSMMGDGSPLLLRACPSPRRVRDTYLYPLNVREQRWSTTGTARLVTMDYQAVDHIAGDAPLSDITSWTYGDLANQITAPTYGDVPLEWADYLDLALRPVT